MKEKINITEAEWPIMEKLWSVPTATAAEIVDAVTQLRQVSMRTVKTLLRRLIAKGAVGYELDPRDARVYHYQALLRREDVVARKNEFFLDQLYGNSVSDMLAHFIKSSDLSRGEIEALKAVLAQKERENA
jgi:BlaI family penicillinase repressor